MIISRERERRLAAETYHHDDLIRNHRQIAPKFFEAQFLWEETQKSFVSLKARQELMVKKFFPRGLFIPRHILPADQYSEIFEIAEQVARSPLTSVGIRTAYSSPDVGKTPWLMQEKGELPGVFLLRFQRKYHQWLSGHSSITPEAIIVMENPPLFGEPSLAHRCFIVRLALFLQNLDDPYCLIEGNAWTDQTRSLEDTSVCDREVHQSGIISDKIFRGRLPFYVGPSVIQPEKIRWESLNGQNGDLKTEELLSQISEHFSQIALSDLLAGFIGLYSVTSHDTIQFQGRIKQDPDEAYFDFFSGYNIRGAEEKFLGQESFENSIKKLKRIKSWEREFR